MKVAGYVRVSTSDQFEEGFSIPEQQDRIKKYCEAKGWTLAKIYTDGGYSGGKIDRPAMQELIKDCRKYEMILVYKLDRLSRSQKDTLFLIEDVFKKNNVDFTSIQENFDTSTPLGMAMIGILSVFAQLEREQIKERMALGKQGKAKEGYWNSHIAPIGYRYIPGTGKEKGKLVINEEEAMIVKEIYRMYLEGKTIRQISIYMSNHYSGHLYNCSSVISGILDNPVYCGLMRWDGEVLNGNHEPIITKEEYDAVQSVRIKGKGRNKGKTKHILTGILYCGECGSKMYYHLSKSKYGNYSYYACPIQSRRGGDVSNLKKHCSNPSIRTDIVEKAVIDTIKDLKPAHVVKPRTIDNSKQIAAIERQIERAAQLYTVEDMDISVVKNMVSDLVKKKHELETEQSIPDNSSSTAAVAALKGLPGILSGDDVEAKIRAVQAIVDRVTADHGNIQIKLNFNT